MENREELLAQINAKPDEATMRKRYQNCLNCMFLHEINQEHENLSRALASMTDQDAIHRYKIKMEMCVDEMSKRLPSYLERFGIRVGD